MKQQLVFVLTMLSAGMSPGCLGTDEEGDSALPGAHGTLDGLDPPDDSLVEPRSVLRLAVIIDDGYYTVSDSDLAAVATQLDLKFGEKTGYGVRVVDVVRERITDGSSTLLSSESSALVNQYVRDHPESLVDVVVLFVPDTTALEHFGRTINRDRTPGVLGVIVDWDHNYAVCSEGSVSTGGECWGQPGVECQWEETSDASGYYACPGTHDDLYRGAAYRRGCFVTHEILHHFGGGSDDHYGTNFCTEQAGVDLWNGVDAETRLHDSQLHCGMCPTLFEAFALGFVPTSE